MFLANSIKLVTASISDRRFRIGNLDKITRKRYSLLLATRLAAFESHVRIGAAAEWDVQFEETGCNSTYSSCLFRLGTGRHCGRGMLFQRIGSHQQRPCRSSAISYKCSSCCTCFFPLAVPICTVGYKWSSMLLGA